MSSKLEFFSVRNLLYIQKKGIYQSFYTKNIYLLDFPSIQILRSVVEIFSRANILGLYLFQYGKVNCNCYKFLMGHCVGVPKTQMKRHEAVKFKSLVHQKQYYLLKLIYADLGSRISENEVNIENFLLFFEKNGYWGDRLFKQFDVGASNLITEEEFIKGIVKIFKTTEEQKIKLLFKFFSGNKSKQSGVSFPNFLSMLYNYPKEDFKNVLNDEEFFNRELRKNLIADNNKYKGRKLDSLSMAELTTDVSGTTFRIQQNYSQCQNWSDLSVANKLQSELLNQISKNKNIKSTTLKIKVGKCNFDVSTTNIHNLVKKFAISIFKSYNINIKTGKLQFEQFNHWMLRHKQLYDNYYKGFHSQIWQIDRKTLKPLFTQKQKQFSSSAWFYLRQQPKKIIISLLHSVLIVCEENDSDLPIGIVCLDGLSAKKIYQQERGYGIQISHRDEIYETKKFYLQTDQLAQKWMDYLKFYKGYSINMLYELNNKIGVGRFSIVYSGKQNSTGQKCAIKVIQSAKLDQEAKKLIVHESSIMSIVSHPFLVLYKQCIQTKTHLFIVTELVEGRDLYEFVKQTPMKCLTESQAAYIIKHIIIGVRYLHSLGIVHRDLKPENIMIEYDRKAKKIEKVKIIDFGFANYLQLLSNLSLRQILAGTPNYIAPEILRVQPQVNYKIDNFAIGSILYFMLSGKFAFDAHSVSEIFQNIRDGNYRMSDKKWKQISPEAKDLISKLLQCDPDDRISLEQALSHAWFSKFLHSSDYQTTSRNESQIIIDRNSTYL